MHSCQGWQVSVAQGRHPLRPTAPLEPIRQYDTANHRCGLTLTTIPSLPEQEDSLKVLAKSDCKLPQGKLCRPGKITFSTSSAFVPMSPHVTRYSGFFATSATLAHIRLCNCLWGKSFCASYLSAVSVLPVPGPLSSQLVIGSPFLVSFSSHTHVAAWSSHFLCHGSDQCFPQHVSGWLLRPAQVLSSGLRLPETWKHLYSTRHLQ